VATEARRPLHIAVMIGASTVLYSASMAGVTAIQSNTDRSLIEHQAPAADAVSRLHDGHDRLEAMVSRVEDAYAAAAANYDSLTPQLADTEAALARLAGRVQKVSGTAQALPGQVALPAISRTITRTVTTSRPATSAKTGASCGC
jgi:hypothetical protein